MFLGVTVYILVSYDYNNWFSMVSYGAIPLSNEQKPWLPGWCPGKSKGGVASPG